MESFPPLTLSKPDRAASVGPQRNSMEDADSSLTRKRPRLDSGSRTYRSMSADGTMATPSTEDSAAAPNTPSSGVTVPKESPESRAIPSLEGAPSKVTINIRDHIQQPLPSVPQADTPSNLPLQDNEDKDELANSSGAELPSKIKSPLSHPISIQSSPSRSPEIEVADVEDMNQEPGQTRWRPIATALDPSGIQATLVNHFSALGRGQTIHQALGMLAQHLEKGEHVCPP